MRSTGWLGTHFISQAELESQKSTCCCLPNSNIKGVSHHVWPLSVLEKINKKSQDVSKVHLQ